MADVAYKVSVEAAFNEDGVWCIDARITYLGAEPEPGSLVIGEARIALLIPLIQEAARGRALGATEALVYLREGDRLTVLDPGGAAEKLGSIQ